MPVDEIFARRKRDAEANMKKRRMTIGSNKLYNHYQQII